MSCGGVPLSRSFIREISRFHRDGSNLKISALPRWLFCALSRSFAAVKSLILLIMRLFAAIQYKFLSMNHLHIKLGSSNQGQSSQIKPNQGKSR